MTPNLNTEELEALTLIKKVFPEMPEEEQVSFIKEIGKFADVEEKFPVSVSDIKSSLGKILASIE